MRGELAFGAALLIAMGVVGCGAETGGRRPVSGKITLKGQPIDEGTIQFMAKDGAGGFGGAPIKDGQYEIPAKHGLTPGAYEVRISAPEKRSLPQEESPGQAPPPAKDRVPSAYNVASKLEFQVPESGAGQFNFDVP